MVKWEKEMAMKISTKGRYALRIMLDIAVMGGSEPVRVKDIAKRQEISVKYMEQIVTILSKAGYLKSIRGPQGGYRLARQPKDYTVGMILRLTEGSLAPVACLEDEPNLCPRQEQCVTLRLWRELDEAIRGVVDKYTLEDLAQWQQEMGDNYVI
ncbi:transcriptional regulator, Rrf2 family [Marvinbryantia formatexigens DSM 14469]|uniref:Transcriptional regulator, Rrf2 family n=2 Tax=Marvinbryantia TaxID=248744 RepID=C6LC81_9FIRM|nr:transcriptional regulator, Rrf2 family [Marvinbryantia formatexigens DSM 14469]